MERDILKYDTDFTSVKVQQAPGGKSSINLSWQPEKGSKYGQQGSNRDDYRNNAPKGRGGQYEEPVQDDYYSAQSKAVKKPPSRGNKYRNYENPDEDRQYDSGRGYETYENPRSTYQKKAPERNYDEYERTYNEPVRNQRREPDPYAREDYGRNNYTREDPGRSNYTREDLGRNEYARESNARESNSRNNYTREDYGRNEPDDYGRAEKRQSGRMSKADIDRNIRENEEKPDNRRRDDYNYSKNNYEDDLNPRRNAKQPPKTSVKVQNPPGGQSSFIFG